MKLGCPRKIFLAPNRTCPDTLNEVGFEDSTNEVPYEARKIILFMRRVKGSEGRASCYWTCKLSNHEEGDMNLLCQHEGRMFARPQ